MKVGIPTRRRYFAPGLIRRRCYALQNAMFPFSV
jgi:hypothetical protein